MKIFLSIAWRNIMRNKKRSFITMFAIAFGLIAVIFMWGLFDGFYPMMVNSMTSMFMGHMQISTEAWVESPDLEGAMTGATGIYESLNGLDGIAAWAPRLTANGLATYAENSQGVAIIGVDPEREKEVGSIYQSVLDGGSYLSEDTTQGAVIGATLAKNLDVSVGDELLVVTSNRFQSLSYIGPLPIVGIMKSGVPQFDSATVFVDRKMLARSLFIDESVEFTDPEARVDNVTGVTTEIAIKVENMEQMEQVQSRVAEHLPAGVVVRNWSEMNPWIEQSLQFRVAFAYIVLAVVLTVAVAGILNTVLMSVMERMREFGIMRALGTSGRQIFLTVSLESILLGIFGILIGAFIGVGITMFFGQVGLDLYANMDEEMMGQFYLVDSTVYPVVNLEHLATTCLIILVSVVIVSLYPARKAARMEPVNAIKALG